MAACRAAAGWAGWICRNDGRAQRVQTVLISGGLSHEAAEVCSIAYSLFEQRPRGCAVGQHVVAVVEQLEAWASVQAGVVGADWKRCKYVPERFDRSEHQLQRRVGKCRELGVCLCGVSEEAPQCLEEDLVAHVEEIAAAGRNSVTDARDRLVVSDVRTVAKMTGRVGWKSGLAVVSFRYSSRIWTNCPKCACSHRPRAPSPCSRIVSSAC